MQPLHSTHCTPLTPTPKKMPFINHLPGFAQPEQTCPAHHQPPLLNPQLSYVHICFQPLSVNVFLFRNEPNKDVVKTVHRLCILVGVLAVLRLPYLGLAYLPASIREWLPGLPDLSLAGTSTVCSWESICGPQTCTTKGNLHLAWTVPLLVS